MGQQAKNKQQKKTQSDRTWQKNKEGDSKVELNHSPEIPDQREDIRQLWPPFRG